MTTHRMHWTVLLLAVALSACSAIPNFSGPTIPSMVPDMNIRQRHAVRLGGAHGPLSDAQSKSVLARLQLHGDETNIFSRHLALEAAIVGSPLVVGNRIDLLEDGPVTYTAMLAAIDQAHDHINIETFIMEDDLIGREFAARLSAMQQRGVQVNLIYDSVGSRNTPAEFFDALASSGVNVLQFNPINPLLAGKDWDVVRRDHRKLLIVDGKVAFIGGLNISSVYSSGSSGKAKNKNANTSWRDTHLRVEGPAVSEFRKLFMATWTE